MTDHDSAAHVAAHPEAHPAFDQFVATIAALRAPDGCPWDREQTHSSIAHNMIEEAYEAVDAIEAADVAHLREELGDVLLQVVLQSQIAADAGEFTIDDVCADVNAKMVRRHPHVFGEAKAESANAVLDLWDQVKLAEKHAAEQAAGGQEQGVARSGARGAARWRAEKLPGAHAGAEGVAQGGVCRLRMGNARRRVGAGCRGGGRAARSLCRRTEDPRRQGVRRRRGAISPLRWKWSWEMCCSRW